MKRLLPLLAGLFLVSCDSGTKHAEGTSSETQTALQALADNAAAIATNLPPRPEQPIVAARRAASDEDSTWQQTERIWCDGNSESQYGGFMGVVYLQWFSPGVGPDGSRTSCSLRESIHSVREYRVDSLGRSDLRYVRHQFDTLERSVYEGNGTWELRSGLSLTYRKLFADVSSRRAAFRQEIDLLGTCRLELSFEDTLTDTGWVNSEVDAPVVCGGKVVGRFLWDFVGAPRVVDLAGRLVQPQRTKSLSFPEDTLGLRARVLGLDRNPQDSFARLHVEIRMGFLYWDTLAVADWIHLRSPIAQIPSVDSARWSGRPVDTLELRIPLRDLAVWQEPNLPYLDAPFRGDSRGAASSKPFAPLTEEKVSP